MAVNHASVIDYSRRRGEISAYGRALSSSRTLIWMVAVTLCLILLLLASCVVVFWNTANATVALLLLLFAALVSVIGLGGIFWFTREHFIEPDLAFRVWLQQVCDGELDARIGLDANHRHYKELDFHTRNLASSLRRLSDDMDNMVESQTRRLSNQKNVLELLFKLTSDVANETGDEAAFATVSRHLADWFEPAQVSCHRRHSAIQSGSKGGELHCIASYDSDAGGVMRTLHNDHENLIHLNQLPAKIESTKHPCNASMTRHWVPFFAGDEPSGVVIIDVVEEKKSPRFETKRVLSSVSEQLSLLCGKQLIQTQMHESRLNRDRNELASDIHDSLAQTLLAIRYQTTLLSEKTKHGEDAAVYQDVIKISSSVEEANEEIRGLIREYRNPLSEHRYADSLQLVIDEFSHESGIPVFFQSDDPQIRFTPREESVVLRIVGEALNNIQKYAKASTVRVFLQRDSSGVRHILVEDDGIGFEQSNAANALSTEANSSGEHIGLTIMRERALSVGANLTIESESGEGTRIAIAMPPLIESQANNND